MPAQKNSASGALEFQESPAVRTKGLAIAVEFKDSDYARKSSEPLPGNRIAADDIG